MRKVQPASCRRSKKGSEKTTPPCVLGLGIATVNRQIRNVRLRGLASKVVQQTSERLHQTGIFHLDRYFLIIRVNLADLSLEFKGVGLRLLIASRADVRPGF